MSFYPCQKNESDSSDRSRLPENENECLLDNRLKKAFEVKVGDTISFVSGTDTELSEDLTQTSYTVTGLVTARFLFPWSVEVVW